MLEAIPDSGFLCIVVIEAWLARVASERDWSIWIWQYRTPCWKTEVPSSLVFLIKAVGHDFRRSGGTPGQRARQKRAVLF